MNERSRGMIVLDFCIGVAGLPRKTYGLAISLNPDLKRLKE